MIPDLIDTRLGGEPPCASCDAVKRQREEGRNALLAGFAFAVALAGYLRARRALAAYVDIDADLAQLTPPEGEASPVDAPATDPGGHA